MTKLTLTEEERLERKREQGRRSARKHYRQNYPKKRAWLKAHPEKQRMYYDHANARRHEDMEKNRESERRSYRKRFFERLGITQEDYNRMMFQQEGGCWICGTEPATHKTSPDKLLIVDHDHDDGTVRGLLCQKCNKALGLFNDDLSLVVQAVHYLTKHAKEAAA